MSQHRRVKLVKITPHLILAMSTTGGEIHARCTAGLPDDVRFVRAYCQETPPAYVIVAESESWPEVALGDDIPGILPIFTDIREVTL